MLLKNDFSCYVDLVMEKCKLRCPNLVRKGDWGLARRVFIGLLDTRMERAYMAMMKQVVYIMWKTRMDISGKGQKGTYKSTIHCFEVQYIRHMERLHMWHKIKANETLVGWNSVANCWMWKMIKLWQLMLKAKTFLWTNCVVFWHFVCCKSWTTTL
jgi:hypothetical protein